MGGLPNIPDHPDIERALRTGYPRRWESIPEPEEEKEEEEDDAESP